MTRHYTGFQLEMMDSISWQLQGYHSGTVAKRATFRMLRDAMRKIVTAPIGRSTEAAAADTIEVDHVVPLAVLADLLIDLGDPSTSNVRRVIDRYLMTAELSHREHRVLLRPYDKCMPARWNPESKAQDNHLERYRVVGIILLLNKKLPAAKGARGEHAASGSGAGLKFPMEAFYAFARSLDLDEEAADIKATKPGKHSTKIRRGRAFDLLEAHDLLETFIRDLWKRGGTRAGRTHIAYCKRIAWEAEQGG